jgi:c-di-GMP-related signal transduction protein
VHGYELLYRADTNNAFDGTAADVATARVIANSFLTIGAERLLNGKPAFINFDATLLTLTYAALLPPRSAVVEILEQTNPTPEVLAACQALRDQGYTLALDDSTSVQSITPWLNVVNIVKVDFRATDETTRAQLVSACKTRKIQTLAEKLETQAEFESAAALGYDYYQGYFFAMPTIITGRKIPAADVALLQLLREASRTDVDFDRVEKVLQCNAALVYKLLRYINSPLFAWQTKIKSVRHAMMLLGQEELRKWICLLLVAGLGHDAIPELLTKCLVRARFAELLAPKMGSHKSSAFLLGLLSHLDALLKCPMEQALAQLNLEDLIGNALLGRSKDALGHLYALVQAYEHADQLRLHAIAQDFHLNTAYVRDAYFTAVTWADKASKA